MKRNALAGFVFGTGSVFGLCLACTALQLAAARLPAQSSQQEITPAPNGPFHIEQDRIIDANGHAFLIRATALKPFHPQNAAEDARQGADFGPLSATSLSAIRLRFNFNAVRLPVEIGESTAPGYFPLLAKVVQRANDADLLMILVGREAGSDLASKAVIEFWRQCAAYFKDYPNVMFEAAAGPRGAVTNAIRAAGAKQPIVVTNWAAKLRDERLFEGAGLSTLTNDPNIIYEVSLPVGAQTGSQTGSQTDVERDTQLSVVGPDAGRSVPVMVNWDLNLEDASACATVPSDPSVVTRMVQANMDYFDRRRMSWSVSSYEPGRLIKDFSFQDATSLENGWSCDHPYSPPAGLGRIVEAHMRASVERGLSVVSGAGGVDVARGGYAIAYGPVMAERDAQANEARLAYSLGGVSVQVTDALGATRPAGLLWVSAGWGQVNFVIPAASALGPARMTVRRKDGSSTSANIIIADTAPGFWTGVSCRGPALGSATQVFPNRRTASSKLSSCKGYVCEALTVPVASGAKTRVRLVGSGFRYAGSADNIKVTIGGVRARVVSFGPSANPGVDQLTIEIPASLQGVGEADLMCHVNGRVANAVRIRIG